MIRNKQRSWLLAALFLFAAPVITVAAERDSQQAEPQVSEKVSTELQKINQLIGAENWEAALLTAHNLLKTTKAGSYDQALTQLQIAGIHLSRNKKELGDYVAAIPLLTAVINSGFWERERTLEWKYILAQLCWQEEKLEEAERYIREWLAETDKPTAEAYVIYVSMLVQRAQKDSKSVDKPLLELALEESKKGLLLGAKPNETLYYLRAACFQGLERWVEAAETLELLLKINPRNKSYWSNLFSMYVTSEDDLRAALTIERAQKFDAMNAPRENIALAQLYHNMKQFDRSIEILEKGLADGSVEPEKAHWEMLIHGYQEMHQEFKAINAALRADKHAKDGYFLAVVGNIYYAMQKNADALKHLEMAAKKGVDNMAQVSLFGAYLAFDLKQYDRASELLDLAEKHLQDDRQRNDYRGLREVVDQALAPQEAEGQTANTAR